MVNQTHLRTMLAALALVLLLAAPSAAPCEQPASSADNGTQEFLPRMGDVFRLGPGDIIQVSVWNDEALTREVFIRPDGFISFPLIGEVRAEGLTVAELSAEIEKKMAEFVPDVPVTVMLMKLGSTSVFVIGKVQQPGVFMLQDQLRVMQVLSMAGGLTTFADKGSIVVLRYVGDKKQVFELDYDDIARGKDLSQNILLQPGDTVIVP